MTPRDRRYGTSTGDTRAIDVDRLPKDLVESHRAVLWNYERRNRRTTKVPYMPHRPTDRAAVNDPSSWGPFTMAQAAVQDGKADGLGIVLGDGLVGIDLDSCRNPDSGEVDPATLAMVGALDSYTEISPSGCGLHVLVRGTLPSGRRRKGPFEVYSDGRYFTVTGQHLDGTPTSIEERTAQLATLHASVFGASGDGRTPGTVSPTGREGVIGDPAIDASDATLVERARAARNGQKFSALWDGDTAAYASHSEGDQALCSLLAFWTGGEAGRIDRLFRQSGLMREKWDERRGDCTYGELSIRRAVSYRTGEARTPTADSCPGNSSQSDNGRPVDREGEQPPTGHPTDSQSGTPPEQAAGTRDSQGTQIVQLALKEGVELFQDENDTAYMDVLVADHHEIHPLRLKRARIWLVGLYFRKTGKAAGSQALADATNVLEALAHRATPRHIGVRILRGLDAIYLDLGDPQWRVVEITQHGWRLLSRPPVPFKRPKGLLPLPEPVRGGAISELRPFVNISDDDDFVLLVGHLLGCLRGRKPYPILVVNGEHGSAKSTLTALIRELIDPNSAPLRAEPNDTRDLMIAAANSHLLSYDNLSHLRLADEFSRLATGAGFSTRTLFENREEEIFCAARPIILNGIPQLATKPDLVSRSIFLTLPTIDGVRRRDEAELWAAFEAARPRILGALLDAVVVALGRLAVVALTRKPRMADFAAWVAAAEPACPWPQGRFLTAYDLNRRGAVDAVLDGDILAGIAQEIAPWAGTAAALLDEVNRRASEDQKRQRDWFRRPRQVRDALYRLAPALREIGIDAIFGEKDKTRNRNRIIRLERTATTSSAASGSSTDGDSTGERSGRTLDDTPISPATTSAEFFNADDLKGAADAPDARQPTCSDSEGEEHE